MTKFALIIALMIIPMLAMISEAVTPTGTTPHFQTANPALTLSQTTSKGNDIILTSRNKGNAPLSVSFESPILPSPSRENNIVYNWNFGDGNASQDKNTTHAFTIPGKYTTTLTITDQHHLVTEYATIITVTDASVSL